MEAAEARRAVAAAMSTASELDLAVDDAIVLSDSNRLVIRPSGSPGGLPGGQVADMAVRESDVFM